MTTYRNISDQQRLQLVRGLAQNKAAVDYAYEFGADEIQRLRKLNNRGFVQIVFVGQASAKYYTTEEGRRLLRGDACLS